MPEITNKRIWDQAKSQLQTAEARPPAQIGEPKVMYPAEGQADYQERFQAMQMRQPARPPNVGMEMGKQEMERQQKRAEAERQTSPPPNVGMEMEKKRYRQPLAHTGPRRTQQQDYAHRMQKRMMRRRKRRSSR